MSEQFDEIWAILKENAKGMQELKERQEENSKRQEENSKQLAELTKKQEENSKQQEENSKQLAELTLQLQELKPAVASMVRGIQKMENFISNTSEILESRLCRSVEQVIEKYGFIEIGGIRYDEVEQNLKGKDNGITAQYDLVLFSKTKHLLLIEVKRKPHVKDFQQVLRQKETFPRLFPSYQDYTIHCGLAGEVFYDELISEAEEEGIYLFQEQAGELQVITPSSLQLQLEAMES